MDEFKRHVHVALTDDLDRWQALSHLEGVARAATRETPYREFFATYEASMGRGDRGRVERDGLDDLRRTLDEFGEDHYGITLTITAGRPNDLETLLRTPLSMIISYTNWHDYERLDVHIKTSQRLIAEGLEQRFQRAADRLAAQKGATPTASSTSAAVRPSSPALDYEDEDDWVEDDGREPYWARLPIPVRAGIGAVVIGVVVSGLTYAFGWN